jgi:hypothetical protein
MLKIKPFNPQVNKPVSTPSPVIVVEPLTEANVAVPQTEEGELLTERKLLESIN